MKKFFIGLLLLHSTGVIAADAMSAFSRKDYNEAYRIWYSNPDTAEAQYGMGRIVLEGLGAAPKNSQKGLGLISKSASKGYRPAIQYMAELNERSGNLQQALRYYESLSNKQDLSMEQKIFGILTRIYKADPTSSKRYCEQQMRVLNLGGSSKEIDMAMCSLRGNDSNKTKEEAELLISQFAGNAYQSKDYPTALTYLEFLSDDNSLYQRGRILYEGLAGNKKRSKEGFELIEKSADLNNKAAMQYLVEFYKSLGDKERTKNYLAKIGDYRGIVEIDLTDKAIYNLKIDHGLCENLWKAKYPSNSSQYEKVLECGFEGMLKEVDPIDSGKKLTKILITKPNVELLIKLLPHLLNIDSDLYNPVAVEQALWALDKNLSNKTISAKLNEVAINFEKVRKLTASNEEQKNNKLAMMLAASASKDKEAVYYLLENDSAKETYWRSENLYKANALIAIIEPDAEAIRYKKIKLRLLMIENKKGQYIKLIREILPSIEKDKNFLSEHLNFLIKSVAANSTARGSQALTTTDVVEISDLILKSTDVQLTSDAYTSIEKFYRDNYINDPGNNDLVKIEANLLKIRKLLEDLRKSNGTKGDDRSKKNISSSEGSGGNLIGDSEEKFSINQSVSDKGAINGSPSDRDESLKKTAEVVKVKEGAHSSEYGRLRYECDQKNATSCFLVGEIISSRQPPLELKNMSEKSRGESALQFFEKSADLNNTNALIVLYDIYSKESSRELRDKADRYLKKLLELKNISGQIRELHNELKFDLVKSSVQQLTKREYLSGRCREAIALLKNKDISESDYKILSGVANGVNCRLLKENY